MTDINDIVKHFVAHGIISVNEVDKITYAETKAEKVQVLLGHISGPLEAGNCETFYILLRIMMAYGVSATKNLAAEMVKKLEKSNLPDPSRLHDT